MGTEMQARLGMEEGGRVEERFRLDLRDDVEDVAMVS